MVKIGINGYYLSFITSGIGQYTFQLLSGLSSIDKINEYYIFSPRYSVKPSLGKNFYLIEIPPFPMLRNSFINRFIWEEFQLESAIAKYSIQLFHSPYPSLPRGSAKIPSVVTIHDAIPWLFGYYKNDFLYWFYLNLQKNNIIKRSNKIITDSNSSRSDIASVYGYEQQDIKIIYPGIDPIFKRQVYTSERSVFIKKYHISSPFIVYSGGFQKHKNLKTLFMSFKILLNSYGYRGKLFILGEIRSDTAVSALIYEKLSDLKSMVHALGIEKNVVFTGFVPKEDYFLFIKSAQIFVSLSLCEGFGMPAVEALSSGTPVVLSKINTYREIESNTAVLVHPLSPPEIAENIHSVLTTESLRQRLRKNGLLRTRYFNNLRMALEMQALYTKILTASSDLTSPKNSLKI